ncbi:MAG: GAF domain-containing protein [Anaerolineales bacterium]|nr:GAF domain-containing protein [Anaerolineales bacterium]
MPEVTISTIARARADIADLRRGLNDLTAWLDEQQNEIPHATETRQRVSQLALFLERLNTGLEQQDRERAQLLGLFQVSRAVNSTLELDAVLNRAMDTIIQVTRAERGFLMLTDEAGRLVFQVARNMDRETITSPTFQVSRSIVERVAQTAQPILTTDAQRDPRFSTQDSIISLNLRSILSTPLMTRDRVIGVVYVDNRLHAGMFQPADLDALRAFADQAAIAIENARLFESVRQKVNEISALKTFQDDIFASIASGVIATDLQDRITAFNRAAETIFALSAARSVGQPYRETLAALAETPLPQLVEEVKRAGARIVGAEFKSQLPERGMVNLSFSISSLQDTSGNPQGITIVVDDLTEKRRLEATRGMFRRYVAPAVVDRLESNPAQLKLGGQRQEVTLLFADIRGFTHLSEQLPPEELVEILNDYLAIAADAILKQEGTLDKFMGDAVMGIFNAPLPQDDHPWRAVRAALAMRAAVMRLHRRLPSELQLFYGIGIHTGDAIVGNVGTEQQMNYTAIGDAVNLAKRLQEWASGGQIVLSEQTCARIRDQVQVEPILPFHVKGREAMVEAWELSGLKVKENV